MTDVVSSSAPTPYQGGAPIPREIVLKEGEVGQATDKIDYPEINSCLTVTVATSDNRLIGGHFVAVPVQGQKESSSMHREFQALLGGHSVKEVVIIGDRGWKPSDFGFNRDLEEGVLGVFMGLLFETSESFITEARGNITVFRGATSPIGALSNKKPIPLESAFNEYFTYEDASDAIAIVPN